MDGERIHYEIIKYTSPEANNDQRSNTFKSRNT
jgi:hypothetical protein